MNPTVLCDPWRFYPLAWIHRIEARAIATELKRLGHAVTLLAFRENRIADLPQGLLLLRLSDPVMLLATRALSTATRPFTGPAAAVMQNCYDKYCAARLAAAPGIDCPATVLARDAGAVPFPVVLKPRQGSDSIGIKLWQAGLIPPRWRTEAHIAQERIRGLELTVGMVRGRMGISVAHPPAGGDALHLRPQISVDA